MTAGGAPVRVLVVDDDPFVRDLLASILEAGGYAVETAADGAAAATRLGSEADIGLVVSDMNMPGLDGLGLIGAVRGAGNDVPIIILTGNNEVTTAIEALKGGANDYLLKDENIQDTIGIAAEQALEKHFLRRQNRQLLADLARENDRLEHEKALAQKVQQSILPRALRLPGLEVEAHYRPSDKIGGDFFDAWEREDGVHFLIGDVSGHSTSSALIMAVAKGILRSLGHALDDPRAIVSAANRMICNIVSESGMFLTLLYGVFRRSPGEIEIVSAGHNPAFLVGGESVRRLEATGGAVGWDADDVWEAMRVPFEPGAGLVLYTDGLTEARDALGREFGEEALEALLAGDAPPGARVESIVRALEGHCAGPLQDDLTLLVLRRSDGDG